MYVCHVKVKKVERSAEWAVCWTTEVPVDDGTVNEYHVKLWGSVSAARKHADEMKSGHGHACVVVMPVYRGIEDRIWIDANLVGHMTANELHAGWYYRSCYEKLIGDEARKMCDQTQDDVYTEAAARP